LRFLVGFGAVVATVLTVWPLLPRRYEASSAVILHASEQDETHTGLKQGILDDGAIQSEMDRMASPLIVDLAIARIGLASDPAFSGQGMVSRLLAGGAPPRLTCRNCETPCANAFPSSGKNAPTP
jgi:uncharacterized protein involved in exopolysaccharide biosynthesis